MREVNRDRYPSPQLSQITWQIKMKRKTNTMAPLAAAFAAVAIGCSSSSSSGGGVMAFSPSSGTPSLLPNTGHHPTRAILPNTSLFPSADISARSASVAWNVEGATVSSTVQRRTALSMSAAPVVTAGAGALAGCLTGGLFAGGLHAIAGESLCNTDIIVALWLERPFLLFIVRIVRACQCAM